MLKRAGESSLMVTSGKASRKLVVKAVDRWGIFKDIAPVGSLIADPSGVAAVPPDLRETALDCALSFSGLAVQTWVNLLVPDDTLVMDIFFGSNLSLKNPNFRTGRCGECHAIPTLTDHTMPLTSKINLSTSPTRSTSSPYRASSSSSSCSGGSG